MGTRADVRFVRRLRCRVSGVEATCRASNPTSWVRSPSDAPVKMHAWGQRQPARPVPGRPRFKSESVLHGCPHPVPFRSTERTLDDLTMVLQVVQPTETDETCRVRARGDRGEHVVRM